MLFHNRGHTAEVMVQNPERLFRRERFAHPGEVTQVREKDGHFPLLAAERDLLSQQFGRDRR